MRLIKVENYLLTEEPKLDWISITSVRPRMLKAKNGKETEIGKIIYILGDNFKFKKPKGNSVESECKSIYIVVNANNISIQFRGTFFALFQDQAFAFIKYIFKKLLENNQCEDFEMRRDGLENNWLLTRVDLKKDIADGREWHQILPIGSKAYKALYDPSGEYEFISCQKRPYENKDDVSTGISYYIEGRWQLNIYDKSIENAQQTNKMKREIYERAIDGRRLIRVELRINSSQSNSYLNWLMRNMPEITEEEFCKEGFAKWMATHQVKTGEHIEHRWKEFFDCENIKKKRNDYETVNIKNNNQMEIAERFLKAYAGKMIENEMTLQNAHELLEHVFLVRQAEYRQQQEALNRGLSDAKVGATDDVQDVMDAGSVMPALKPENTANE